MELKIQDIDEVINNFNKTVSDLKTQIKNVVPIIENQNITRINKSCFIMKKSNLDSTNWSPEYYDFNLQRNIILDLIDRSKPEDLKPRLENMFNSGTVLICNSSSNIHGSYTKYTFRFNRTYLDQVQKALKM